MVLGIIPLVGEHGADAGHDRECRQEQPVEDQRVVDVGRGGGAGDRNAAPSTATWYLVPRLARSVGLGPVRSLPRLAPTEQLSRIRSGWPCSMPTSTEWARANRPVLDQRAKQRRRVEPLASTSVALRLRHGVPSRRNRRSVASTRTVSQRGCPRPPPRHGPQRSTTAATRCKILSRNAVFLVWGADMVGGVAGAHRRAR